VTFFFFLNNGPCYGELLRPFISVLHRSKNDAGLARPVSRLSYGLDDPGFKIRQVRDFSLFQKRPDRLWVPSSLLFNAHWVSSHPASCSMRTGSLPIQPPVQCALRSLPIQPPVQCALRSLPIQPPVQRPLGSLPLGVNRPGHEGYNNYLVSRLRMTGAMSPLPHIPSRLA